MHEFIQQRVYFKLPLVVLYSRFQIISQWKCKVLLPTLNNHKNDKEHLIQSIHVIVDLSVSEKMSIIQLCFMYLKGPQYNGLRGLICEVVEINGMAAFLCCVILIPHNKKAVSP